MASSKGGQPKTFSFKYVKNHDFKTVTVHGAYGGLTVRGEININFYSEVNQVPAKMVHAVNEKGQIGGVVQAQMQGVAPEAIREMPFAINMDLATAKAFQTWFNDKITLLEKAKKYLQTNNNTDAVHPSSE